MNWKLIFPTIFLCTISVAAHAERLSLNDALNRLDDSPSIKASKARIEISKGQKDEALGALLPTVVVQEMFGRSDDPVHVFGAKLQQGKFGMPDFAINKLNDPDSINHWVTSFQVMQPILHSGINWKMYGSAKQGVKASALWHDFDKQKMRYGVSKAYYAIVAMQGQKRIMSNAIARLKKLENEYQLMEHPNSATTTSYLISQSIRINIEAERTKLDRYIASAKRDLNAMIGNDVDHSIDLTDPLPPVKMAIARINFKPSEGERADVAALEHEENKVADQMAAAKLRWGPDIDAYAAYNIYTGDFKSSQGAYEVGLRLMLPLLTWRRTGRIRTAEAALYAVKNRREAAELSAMAKKKSAEASIKSSIREYRLLASASSKADAALKQAGIRYSQGTLPLKDYSEAIRNWVEMHGRLIDGKKNVANCRIELDFQRGTL